MKTSGGHPFLPGFEGLNSADYPAGADAGRPAYKVPETPPPALPETLKLERPLVFFDIESTGLDVSTDRIISITLVRYAPDRVPEVRDYLLNPGRPIPAEATKIHGITDAQVLHCPQFADVAEELSEFLEGADLGGYNLGHFDIPMLTAEFRRANISFGPTGRRVIDPQSIFFRREPRTLSAAVAFYCGHELDDAHDAKNDIYATIEVLGGQYARYGDLPGDVGALDDYCVQRRPEWVDRTGRLRWLNGEVAINFGQKKGRLLREIVRYEPSYIAWALNGDFPDDFKRILRAAQDRGEYPKPVRG